MIAVAGLSHLGIVTSAALAAKGFDLIAFDERPGVADALAAGMLPISEPGLDNLLDKARYHLRYTASAADLTRAEVVFITRDVPTDASNRADSSVVDNILKAIEPHLAKSAIVVVMSQVSPGFLRPRHDALAKKGVLSFYQVETLVFGSAVERATLPERYIVGCENPSQPLPPAYRRVLEAFNCPILTMRIESAELSKIAINCYLASTVAVTNTLAALCEKNGADWAEIAPALRLDKRIGQHAYLAPGLGLAGGNIERDLIAVLDAAALHGTEAGTAEAWLRMSAWRRNWPLHVLSETLLGRQKKSSTRIAIWGLAYKLGTHSLKNAPSVEFIEHLQRTRPALSIATWDPIAPLPTELTTEQCRQHDSPLDALDGADALVIFTPHPELSTVPIGEIVSRMHGRLVIDPFRVLPLTTAQAAGLRIVSLGVPSC